MMAKWIGMSEERSGGWETVIFLAIISKILAVNAASNVR
jgi:hypothetical protein